MIGTGNVIMKGVVVCPVVVVVVVVVAAAVVAVGVSKSRKGILL